MISGHREGAPLNHKPLGLQRNIEMRRRLNSLTANARENDALYEQTRALVLNLLEATTVSELTRAFNDAMANDFKVEHSAIVLFGDPAQLAPVGQSG